jgi:hypothetical protein
LRRDQRIGLFSRLGLRSLRGGVCGRAGLGKDGVAFGCDAGAGLGDLGQCGIGLVLRCRGLVQHGLRGLLAPGDGPGDRAPEDAAEKPDEDQDVDGLKTQPPPIQRHATHASSGLANSSRSAITRQ